MSSSLSLGAILVEPWRLTWETWSRNGACVGCTMRWDEGSLGFLSGWE